MIEPLYIWEDTFPDKNLTRHLATLLDLPPSIARALVNRNITDEDSARRFLNPNMSDMHDPWLFEDMEKATTRIISALQNHERMLVLGDYDTDGITGTTLLVSFLESQGGHVKYYIPDRLTEGYGLSMDVLKKAQKAEYGLIVTVDTGISSIAETKFATEVGIDLIITDHHEPHDELPAAVAVVNPKCTDSKYPFRGLAGVGVAFKLVLAVADKLNIEAEEIIDQYIDVVALGTVADLVPLRDENRFLVKRGLANMNKSRNHGLYSLLEISHIREDDRMDTTHVSFRMAPRINAAGRLWTPRAGVELLMADSPDRARLLARKLDEKNRARIQEEARIFKSASTLLEEKHNPDLDGIILLYDEDWHVGVIGIVASKLMERFHRPVLLATTSRKPEDMENPHPEKGAVYQGSARSFIGFDMYAGLSECSDLLLSFGGHQLAAGIKIYEENLPELKRRLGELVKGGLGDISCFRRSLVVDAEVSLYDVTMNLLKKSRALEPCGIGNPKPVFRANHVTVLQAYSCGVNGNVLRLKLGQGDAVRTAVGFGMGANVDVDKISHELVDIVFDIQPDNYAGRNGLCLKLKDIRLSGAPE